MEYRHLGKAGIRVSALSLGSWVTFHNQVGVDAAVESMKTAYEAGVNFFDNAEIYANGKSEEIMGTALKKLSWRRGSYLISTKLFWGIHDSVNEKNTLNRKYLVEGLNNSLKRLDMEYVDLVYCHRPDPHTPLEEIVWTMHNLIEWGKALYWGTSEWPAADIMAAIEIADKHHLHKPVTEQPQYNMFYRKRVESEYARLFKDYGYGSTIWSPLASGLLTGKYNNGIPEGSRGKLPGYEWLHDQLTNQDAISRIKQLQVIASGLGFTIGQVAIAWCLKNPNVSTVITGASRVEQVRENLKAIEVLEKLTPDVMGQIEEIIGRKDLFISD